jgi:Tfp pilus assembly protein PilZ
MTKSLKEKRHTNRLTLNMPVDLKRLELFEMSEAASLEDISPEGVFIATKQTFKNGAEIELSLTFPNENPDTADFQKNVTVNLKAEVVWCGAKLLEDERRKIDGIGVRFKQMDAETLEQVLSLYERLSSHVS